MISGGINKPHHVLYRDGGIEGTVVLGLTAGPATHLGIGRGGGRTAGAACGLQRGSCGSFSLSLSRVAEGNVGRYYLSIASQIQNCNRMLPSLPVTTSPLTPSNKVARITLFPSHCTAGFSLLMKRQGILSEALLRFNYEFFSLPYH